MLLGFDIGGTKCAVVIGNEDHQKQIQVLDKRILVTDQPVYEMIALLFLTAEQLLTDNSITIEEVTGIGISCGGPLSSKKGLILSPPNLPGWDNVPIVEMAEKRFGKKVLLQNDANAGAVAEWKYGAGRGIDNMIFLTFGTGMGAGLILDGRLYSGISDLAGEVGHLRLSETGPVGFGKAGSFEGWCSGGGIAQIGQMLARQRIQMGEKVLYCKGLEDLTSITAKTIADAALLGDATAKEVYILCAQYLGKGLALLIDILNPEVIVLGSIFGRARILLEEEMTKTIEMEAFRDSNNVCQIVSAELQEQIGDIAALSLALIVSENTK
ncbi:ROK family protein [Pedobacter sp. B4-66]|uniref:ROK family protein n=1 Tax=Pedobacter sp. B4-66 TaxID=2817280 RepID=UPI001BDB2DEB|nr:ROK family protein [Pedobacter sp. B4-66]